MQQLMIEKGTPEWREALDARIEGDGEAVVRPVAVATCDLDLWVVRGIVPTEDPLPLLSMYTKGFASTPDASTHVR